MTMARLITLACLAVMNTIFTVFWVPQPTAWRGVNPVITALAIYGISHIELMMLVAIGYVYRNGPGPWRSQ